MGRRVTQYLSSQIRQNSSSEDQIIQQILGGQVNQYDNQRIVMLHGDVTEYSISQVMGHIINLASTSAKPIKLIVSSYGGAVHEMLGLIDLIRSLDCQIHTIALGKIMSAGTIIAAAGTKGHRMIGHSTRVMLHSISSSAIGTLFQMENEVREGHALQETISQILLRDTSITKKQLDEIMKQGHDHYYTSHEAVKLGIADKVIGS